MNLRETILKEHSKKQCTKIVKWVGDKQERFDELISLLKTDVYQVVQRAAWPMSYCVKAHPSLIKKHFPGLIKLIKKKDVHGAVKRNIVRLWQFAEIPAKHQGTVMDICFSFLVDPETEVAVKAFSLEVLQRMSKKYPEILQELKTIIEDRWDFETAAFKSKGRKILKMMDK